jgi:hypothetical protein
MYEKIRKEIYRDKPRTFGIQNTQLISFHKIVRYKFRAKVLKTALYSRFPGSSFLFARIAYGDLKIEVLISFSHNSSFPPENNIMFPEVLSFLAPPFPICEYKLVCLLKMAVFPSIYPIGPDRAPFLTSSPFVPMVPFSVTCV